MYRTGIFLFIVAVDNETIFKGGQKFALTAAIVPVPVVHDDNDDANTFIITQFVLYQETKETS
jgi:hypothetical protein